MVDYLIFVITRHELPNGTGTNGLQDEWIWFLQKHWLRFIKRTIKNNQIFYSISHSHTDFNIKYAQNVMLIIGCWNANEKSKTIFVLTFMLGRVFRLDLQD